MIKTAPHNRLNQPPRGPTSEVQQDFEQIDQTAGVEHLSVVAFMRRIAHRWDIDDMTRFGNKVGKVAESMQLAYLTGVDRSLGTIRIFPVPLLERVYKVMSAQFGWPQIIDAAPPGLPATGFLAAETLKTHERLHKLLHAAVSATEDTNVQHSFAVLMHWLEEDMKRLREELGMTTEATPPQ